jgi:hypothetical protein
MLDAGCSMLDTGCWWIILVLVLEWPDDWMGG